MVTKNSSIVYMLCNTGMVRLQMDYRSSKLISAVRTRFTSLDDRCIGIAYNSKYDRIYVACVVSVLSNSTNLLI